MKLARTEGPLADNVHVAVNQIDVCFAVTLILHRSNAAIELRA